MKAETTKQLAGSRQQNSIESESAMPGKMPPNFALTAGSGDDWSKDGKYKGNPGALPRVKFDGPLAAQGPGDKDAFDATDVFQGGREDCWFLAAAAAIAKANPALMRNIIEETGENCYAVTLYMRDPQNPKLPPRPMTTYVNNAFPVSPATRRPVFAQVGGDQGEIWVMVLEKAFQQLKGKNYEAIDYRSFPSEAYEMLTGNAGIEKSINHRHDTAENQEKHRAQEARKFERQSAKDPFLTSKGQEKFMPANMLRELEVIPYLKKLQSEGYAINLNTTDLGGIKKIGQWELLGPHCYTLDEVDEARQTIAILDPNGKFHEYHLPVAMVTKYFQSITAVQVGNLGGAKEGK